MHGWGADPNAIGNGDTDRYRFTHLETRAGTVNVSGDELNKIAASGHSKYGTQQTSERCLADARAAADDDSIVIGHSCEPILGSGHLASMTPQGSA